MGEYDAKKGINSATRRFVTFAISAAFTAASAYLAEKGLDIDLSTIVNQPELVNAVTALVVGAVFWVLEFLRNRLKHKHDIRI